MGEKVGAEEYYVVAKLKENSARYRVLEKIGLEYKKNKDSLDYTFYWLPLSIDADPKKDATLTIVSGPQKKIIPFPADAKFVESKIKYFLGIEAHGLVPEYKSSRWNLEYLYDTLFPDGYLITAYEDAAELEK